MAKQGIATRPAAEQIDEILGWMIEGLREEEIERRVSQEMPAVPRGILLAALADRLRAAAQCDRDVAIGFALEAYRDLYAKARAAGDIAQARGAIKDWISLALRHNVLDGDEIEEAEGGSQAAPDDDGPRAGEKRGAVEAAKPKSTRRAGPPLRRPGPSEKT